MFEWLPFFANTQPEYTLYKWYTFSVPPTPETVAPGGNNLAVRSGKFGHLDVKPDRPELVTT